MFAVVAPPSKPVGYQAGDAHAAELPLSFDKKNPEATAFRGDCRRNPGRPASTDNDVVVSVNWYWSWIVCDALRQVGVLSCHYKRNCRILEYNSWRTKQKRCIMRHWHDDRP